MKIITRKASAQEGIREENGKLVFDFQLDKADDFLSLTKQELYKGSFLGNIYRYGYQFSKGVDSKDRARVIHFIKGLATQRPKPADLHSFIEKPLVFFDKEINLTTIDCVITPRSERSTLVQQVIQQAGDFLRHDVPPVFFELIKSLPEKISVDWDKFINDIPFGIDKENDNRHRQIRNTLWKVVEEAKLKDYFSIAQSVPTKYRHYIKNYLNFASQEDEEAFKALQNKRLLLIDDVNTSGSTLKEILRIVKQVNSSCEIYIFTLIGNQ